jgi:CheY-like chemotaxis protein
LLSNSAKYTNRGGEITVSVQRVETRAIVTVKDTGIGIAPDALGTVFEMFSQGNPQHARAEGGLGIGLALVRMLVERHEGTVEAFSDGPNQGSMFIVSLPVAAVGIHMSHDVAATSRFAGGAAKRVLVVDDNVDAAASLMMLLQMGGHEVKSASDGVEAVDIASTFSPQIIFMDLGMPRMDGLEASRRIRALKNGRSIVIVALTGWGQEADRKRTRNAGIDHHLVKPVSIQELEHVLKMAERR